MQDKSEFQETPIWDFLSENFPKGIRIKPLTRRERKRIKKKSQKISDELFKGAEKDGQ